MNSRLVLPMDESYYEYLSDESSLTGEAASISFPVNEEEIREIILAMKHDCIPVTIQGGRTGIVGGAVPHGGHIMNLSRMNRIQGYEQTADGKALMKVGPGITLLELEQGIGRTGFPVPMFWPPDPTEPSATVGGIISSGSKGCSSYYYGETRRFVESLRVMDAEGRCFSIRRREDHAGAVTNDIDLYIGSEGIFGVITEITLLLLEKPQERWGICFFFRERKDSLLFAAKILEKQFSQENACITSLEYLDRRCIELLGENKEFMTGIQDLPEVPPLTDAVLYTEIQGRDEDSVGDIADILLDISTACGSDPDQSWALSGEREVCRLHAFRHALPESVNLRIRELRRNEPAIVKLGTDITCRKISAEKAVSIYEKGMSSEGLDGCIFGHIGNGHLHVNILPRNLDEYERGNTLIESWAEKFCFHGGTAISEHGAGKLRKKLLLICRSEEYLSSMRDLKDELDPHHLWNPGNVLSDERRK